MKGWMEENCNIAFIDDKGPVALSDFTKFISNRRCDGQMYPNYSVNLKGCKIQR